MRRPGYLGDYDGIFDWFKPKKKKETPPEVIAAKAPATDAPADASAEEAAVARPEGCPPCPPCNAARADEAKTKPKKEKKPDEEKGWFRRWFS